MPHNGVAPAHDGKSHLADRGSQGPPAPSAGYAASPIGWQMVVRSSFCGLDGGRAIAEQTAGSALVLDCQPNVLPSSSARVLSSLSTLPGGHRSVRVGWGSMKGATTGECYAGSKR